MRPFRGILVRILIADWKVRTPFCGYTISLNALA